MFATDYELPDPMAGYCEPSTERDRRPACECEDGGKRCWVCVEEWAAMESDADAHHEDDAAADDPWLATQRDDEADDEVWGRLARLEACYDGL